MRTRIPQLALAAALVAVLVIPAGVMASDTFVDVPTDNVFHGDIAWLAETGVTRGCNPPENTEFCPDDDVTRGQMAAFLHRFDGHLKDTAAANVPGALANQLAAANRATAAYQDVEVAEADGYASTIGDLGCHQNPGVGGMGVHYLDASLMDGVVSATAPEALVYELDHNGDIAGLVAHEYIVPLDAWTEASPPTLFGQEFTQHPVLPIWKLHAWVWKDNPVGTFADWNPKARLCPAGVPIFGVDVP
ncbi:MAG TPA: S-layer homology domain-containing protein [Acidimicrobiia bacterium]|nr:S-layer homology domain-containing protein [Acidimicrobiia bacterium]